MKPLVGISACLLGESVRYNGGHKRDSWLTQDLAPHVQWHPTCPEVEMGLGVPREAMRLKRFEKKGKTHLVGTNSQTDFTELAENTSQSMVSQLPQNLNGYILKNKSPSCGLEKLKVYDAKDFPFNEGIGFFAKHLKTAFPELPLIEEGHLNNAHFREHFVTRLFAHHAIHSLENKTSALQKLHQRYKFVIQAHDEASLRKLGPLAANSEKQDFTEVLAEYRPLFLQALSKPATVGTRVNALQHIYGFVKDRVSDLEKKNILENIEKYRAGELPYIATLAVLKHLIEKYEIQYIEEQYFFSPYPENLRLNHTI